MITQIEWTGSSRWMRVRRVVASILCVMGLPLAVVLVLADVQPALATVLT